ncbi:DUF4372 domain-containing protein [Bacillus norwichensis]|uniref:DUF4372 domain-containing protein n=1 Tax=Bacillus norwichensis TaxID=2762217 RepID=A0ABR8VHN9_9BACI|nr:DUF4372 domain-containing protein [Bacillus norwichensis]MBD8004288.1 DUF4372 domain-containing protein [Bacillus norwichensis]
MDKHTLFTSFGKWVNPITDQLFGDGAFQVPQDLYTKKLTTTRCLLLFLYAQLQKCGGLRAISDDLLMKDFQKELGLDFISASQLSRKNRQVEPVCLLHIWQSLTQRVRMVSCGRKRHISVKLLDSSTIPPSLNLYEWATFRSTKSALKLHLLVEFINEQDIQPEKLAVTPAEWSDVLEAPRFITELGVTHVIDRGYYDFQLFDQWCHDDMFFATRVKSNTVVDIRDLIYDDLEQNGFRESLVIIGSAQKKWTIT